MILLGISYNRPILDADAIWNDNAITYTAQNIDDPRGIFVNTNDQIFLASRGYDQILMWFNKSTNSIGTISSGLYRPCSVFVLFNNDILIDNGDLNGRVDRWISKTNTIIPVMNVLGSCFGLFVDINNVLYCSINSHHRVVKKSLDNPSNITTIVAGIGCEGSTSYMLRYPSGIFVDINLDLYVADSGNGRIQLFREGQLNGTTIAGNGAPNTTILSYPTGIVLDAQKYLFIVDRDNNRIVFSGPNGYRCIAGCSGFHELHDPWSFSFDSYGNIYVADIYHQRIQKFLLATNSSGKLN